VALISLSKHTRRYFPIIIAFGHSEFIRSQSMFLPTNMVLHRYLVCRTFSKCQPYSNESCLSIHRVARLAFVREIWPCFKLVGWKSFGWP